ncbi:uncharacterized protein LOC135713033 [Ochlerotatus camptorhynchus]|uniref:uncharacterized protein LOC135713033 n=1 Tax=Ochlerotatus camptorhynchus TaxID=644619 RepID=UPI0031E21207
MLQHRTILNVERYRQAWNSQNSVCRRKKRQQEDQDSEAMDNLYRVNDTRKFYEKLNSSRKGYIDGDEIEVVDEFVYLESLVTAENDTSREIQRRIMAGNRAYFGLRRTLLSNKIRHRTKLTVYKTLIRPVVLYGHESWTMVVEDQRAIGDFERKVLRTIYDGVQMDDGTWRRRPK